MSLPERASKSAESLLKYQASKKLLGEFFIALDSVGYVPPSPREFDKRVSEAPQDAAKLYDYGYRTGLITRASDPIRLGKLGVANWVEYIQPTDEDDMHGRGAAYLNFLFPDLETANFMLQIRGVEFFTIAEEVRNEIAVTIDGEGNQFRLVDRPAEDIARGFDPGQKRIAL